MQELLENLKTFVDNLRYSQGFPLYQHRKYCQGVPRHHKSSRRVQRLRRLQRKCSGAGSILRSHCLGPAVFQMVISPAINSHA